VVRVDLLERRLVMLAGEQVDHLEIDVQAAFLGEQHERAAGGGRRVVVDLHCAAPLLAECWKRESYAGFGLWRL
jgi:hypothetical protein